MLPIYDVKEAILSALTTQGRLVLTAPTGSGKSTQVPRFLLDTPAASQGRILVLQPRRLAARMLAERVAEEDGSPLGKKIGFQTRYEKVCSAETKVLFITEGILTRMLVSDPTLQGISAIIFDEFHERSMNTDLGIAMTWRTRQTWRPDLQIIVMSATMDSAPVSQYLDNAPVITSEGRLFPVDISYCDQTLKMQGPALAAAKTLFNLLQAGKTGDVLIFMPGGYEIRKTIEACRHYAWKEELLFLPLYGDLPPAEQRKVMAPAACRKVIVATNIAETSLTIPGVRHVIDSGLVRISRYDAVRGIDSLTTESIARDAADQRAGRAGREAPGSCCRLWSWLEQSAKPARTIPEIQRMDLAEAVLAITAYGFPKTEGFPWYDRPPAKMLDSAEKMLFFLGFTTAEGRLTELGKHLSRISAPPRLSLLMYLGHQRGCFVQTSWAAALLSERPLITRGSSSRGENTIRRQEAKNKARETESLASDFLTRIQLVQSAEQARFAPDYCDKIGVQPGAARDIARSAKEFLKYERLFENSNPSAKTAKLQASETALLQVILQAFPDRLACRQEGSLFLLSNGKRAMLAPESVICKERLIVAAELREISGNSQSTCKTELSLCSGVSEEWLLDLFPESWDESDETYWDERRQQVLRHQTLSCLGVLLEDKVRTDPDPQMAAQLLAEQLQAGKAPIPNWDDKVNTWIARATWVADLFPEEELPRYDEAGKNQILQALCQGETSLKQLKNKETLSFVKNLLSWKQQQFVEKMAPESLPLPNGRKMKLHYVPGQQPKGSAKIYDLYDLPDLPVIANGRSKVLLDILAPNFRTVQITDDLANFWKVLYPKVKPELARRYPRHPWR